MRSLFRILFGILLLLHVTAHAQYGNYNAGGRSRGIANTSITISDAFAAYNNIAGLALQDGITICLFSSIYYGIPGLLAIGAGVNSKIHEKGAISLNFYRFGDNLFNEHKIGCGYSHEVRFVSLGCQINYIQYKIEGYGSKGLPVFELGGIVKMLQKLHFGAYISYPLQSDPFHTREGILPILLKTGMSYRPVSNLMLNIEYQYYLHQLGTFSTGLEYVIRKKIALRTGIILRMQRSSFGIGFMPGNFRINYAVDIHPLLGISQEVSVTLKISNG
jgi:hypothetical protein